MNVLPWTRNHGAPLPSTRPNPFSCAPSRSLPPTLFNMLWLSRQITLLTHLFLLAIICIDTHSLGYRIFVQSTVIHLYSFSPLLYFYFQLPRSLLFPAAFPYLFALSTPQTHPIFPPGPPFASTTLGSPLPSVPPVPTYPLFTRHPLSVKGTCCTPPSSSFLDSCVVSQIIVSSLSNTVHCSFCYRSRTHLTFFPSNSPIPPHLFHSYRTASCV